MDKKIIPYYRTTEAYWWEMFVPQLAILACEHDLDARTDIGFECTVELLRLTAKYN